MSNPHAPVDLGPKPPPTVTDAHAPVDLGPKPPPTVTNAFAPVDLGPKPPPTVTNAFAPVDLGPKPPPTVVDPFAGVPSTGSAHMQDTQVASAARFIVQCHAWSTAIGFSELAGFTSEVAHQEYSYNGMTGNVLTRQMGRASAPTITLKSALQKGPFARLSAWHDMARMNNPLAKAPAMFAILDAAGDPQLICVLTEAWCSKLEIDPVQAGAASVVMMRATIQCDSVQMT